MPEPRESRAFEEFVLHPDEAFERLRQTARPETLVRADGREIVVMDAAAFDALAEPPITAEEVEAVRKAVEAADAGERTYSVEEAFAILKSGATV